MLRVKPGSVRDEDLDFSERTLDDTGGGGLPEAIGPCGLIFRNGSVEELAAVLAELLHAPDRLEALRLPAADHLAAHRSDLIAQRYLAAIEAGLAARARAPRRQRQARHPEARP